MRVENWPELMAAEIEAAKQRTFRWGIHDCCAFAANVVAQITGRDFMIDFPDYQDEAQANYVMSAWGGVEGIATRCLGEPIAPLQAQRGDVVSVDTELGPALGICDGAVVWAAAVRGLVALPLAKARRAWRVA